MKTAINRICVYDLETGHKGVDKDNPITEIAIVSIDSHKLEIVDEYETLVAPYKDEDHYDEDTAIYTGISLNDIKERGRDSKQVAADIKSFAKKQTVSSKKPILAGHNIFGFDNPIFEFFLKDHKSKISIFNAEYGIDTQMWAYLRWLSAENYQLGTSCAKADITLRNAHRAMIDARANAKLVIDMLKSLRGAGKSGADEKRSRETFEI